jgi:hypothetical protein
LDNRLQRCCISVACNTDPREWRRWRLNWDRFRVGRLSPKITGEGGEVSKKVAELAQLFSSLCPAKLARIRLINQAKSTCVRNKRSKK